jgi:hypothetical protein
VSKNPPPSGADTPFGRVYAFYTDNGDRVHLGRDDTHGWHA